MDPKEIAIEHLEHGRRPADAAARRVAVLVTMLAAALALSEMGETMSQNAYLTHHIQLTNTRATMEALDVHATMLRGLAEVMASLPNAADPAVARRAAAARASADQLDNSDAAGDPRQLNARADVEKRLRDAAFHRYHMFEAGVAALQIAIVMASVSVITRAPWLSWTAATVGGMAGLFGIGTALGVL